MTELLALDLAGRCMHAIALDGSGVRTVVEGLTDMPDGIVVDQLRGHIYWTNMGRPDPGFTPGTEPDFFSRNGSVERVDLDGGNRRYVVEPGGFTTGKQITADFEAGRLYWCDREGMQVLTCDLDGGDLHPLIVTGEGPEDAGTVRNWCVGICVDLDRRLLYWTQKGPAKGGDGRILRAPLDLPAGVSARDRVDVTTLFENLPEPIDLELHGTSLLWTDRGAPPDGNSLNRATVVPEPGPAQVLSRGYREAIGLASIGSRFYVSDLGGTVRAVDLDTGTESVLARLGSPLTGLAVADLA
ncbi:hypothetical protein ACFYTF_24480 [Nocardia thailandica]|uniref:3-hydroxyacyl-CoA dehydrogenase n=1 Tax=Nocardia thailandica TaxID=257275 RepID=A0ABW6PUF3_9NOCA